MRLAGLLLCLIISANSCKKENTMDDLLSIKKAPYAGSELRTGGYYYNEYIPGYLTVYFFYTDGTVLYGNSFSSNELSFHEVKYSNGAHYNYAKNLKYYWGIFKIEGNELLFERWYPSQPPLKAYIRSGAILNDTTFIITEFYRMQGGQKTNVESRNEMYHFKVFNLKPDSTNSFVK
jgi:hypothetical protein